MGTSKWPRNVRTSRWLATGSDDKTVKIWDVDSGKELLSLTHDDVIWSVEFSPDSKRIITPGFAGTAKIWDTADGRELLSLRDSTNKIEIAAFSPDGLRAMTLNSDGMLRVWDAYSGNELLSRPGPFYSVVISPDGKLVLSTQDSVVTLSDIATGRELLTLQGHSDFAMAAGFSPNGQFAVTISVDGTAKLWKLEERKEFLHYPSEAGICSIALSPKNNYLLTSSWDQTARVWSVTDGQELRTLSGHRDTVWAGAFTPDELRIVTASFDRTAKIWDTATGKELLQLEGHTAPVHTAMFSADGLRIVTAGADRTARVWDASNGHELLTLRGHTAGITSAGFSPDGMRVVTGSDDHTSRIWDSQSGDELLRLEGHTGPIQSVAFSSDGKWFVTASYDNTAKIWNAATGVQMATLRGHSDKVHSVSVSSDSQRVLTGSFDRTAKLWDIISGQELLTLRGAHTEPVRSAIFSADGARIFTASADHTVRTWEAASPHQVDAWRVELQTATDTIAMRKRQMAEAEQAARSARAHDPGVVRKWLVLLPIDSERKDGSRVLEVVQLDQEAQLRPRDGDSMQLTSGQRLWRVVELEDMKIDFNELAGGRRDFSVAYAVTYLRCKSAHTGVLVKIGSDDESRLYLNGKLIFESLGGRSYMPDQDIVTDVELQAGLNTVLFKVANGDGDWAGSVRFLDRNGQPLSDLTVTLDPGDNEK